MTLGNMRENGTLANHSAYYQTNPNNTQMDNFGTRGKRSPYTGQLGTRAPRY
jgi:hypothetical protein